MSLPETQRVLPTSSENVLTKKLLNSMKHESIYIYVHPTWKSNHHPAILCMFKTSDIHNLVKGQEMCCVHLIQSLCTKDTFKCTCTVSTCTYMYMCMYM